MTSTMPNREVPLTAEARISYLRQAQVIKLKAALETIANVSDDVLVQSLIKVTMSDVEELQSMEHTVKEDTYEHNT